MSIVFGDNAEPFRGSVTIAVNPVNGKTAQSDRAKRAMAEAAIDLTLDYGAAGWTLRDVNRRAGQGNNSAVQYHFGDREALMRAGIEVVIAGADLELMPPEAHRYTCYLAHLLASTWADLVWSHPVVIEAVGDRHTPEAHRWAMEILEHAFVTGGQS